MWHMLAVAICACLFSGEAQAWGDRARLTLEPNIIAAAGNGSQLRMRPVVAADISERPGDRQKERLRRSKLMRTLGIATATGAAAVLGGVLAGPAYGAAAAGAVLIIYLILP